MVLIVLLVIAVPVDAMDFTAPEAPQEVQKWLPEESENFGDDLLTIVRSAVSIVHPSAVAAFGVCASLIAISILVGMLHDIATGESQAIHLAGVVLSSTLLFRQTNTLIQLGTTTVQEISQYGKMLLPVMTGALAAQGAVNQSAALYVATAFFDALLTSAVSEVLLPLIYIFLSVSVCVNLFGHSLLRDIGKFIKWLLTWGLKVILYLFTGYISITGVVGGTTDATILKATKLTISGMVPVVGNILSDASEAVLVSAGVMKNAVGIYGLLVIIAIWIGPFLQIGVQYLMLKITAGISEMIGSKKVSCVVKDFSTAMGLVLAMTGTLCIIFLISVICFMKGIG